jgi:Flp pilus assembly protein TadG
MSRGKGRGFTLMYCLIAMTTLFGLVSLGVDLGRVQLAKSEAQAVADAAARAGAVALGNGTGAARSAAITLAGQSTVDASAVSLSTSDIDIGRFSGGVFSANVTPYNAVRVRCARTAAKGNAIPLLFGKAVGQNSCDIHAAATVMVNEPTGFVGLNGITMKNNMFIASYNSRADTSPTQMGARSNGSLVSNGPIEGKNNNDLYGTVILGPKGSIKGVTVHGSTSHGTTKVESDDIKTPEGTPTMSAWTPGANPASASQSYTVNGNVTLPGGTYYFSALTVNGSLKFSGAAKLYINGDVDLNGTLAPNSLIPSDLKIYQLNAGNFGDSGSNGIDLVGVVVAPNTTFTAKNNATVRGSMTFDTMTFKNNADLFYDENLGAVTGPIVLSMTQ